MDDKTLSRRAIDLKAKLPPDGTRVTNRAVREAIGLWALTDDYWVVRDHLIEKQEIYRTTGRGGSVGVVIQPSAPSVPPIISQSPLTELREDDLYAPIKKVLVGDWAKDERLDGALVEITAKQGARNTGGAWTRPDLVVVAVRTFSHLPNKHLDVITFEVKSGMDILGVFEAAAHARVATRAFLIFKRAESAGRDEELRDRILGECRRLNIGLIEFDDAGKYDTWETVWDPDRREPNPEELDRFLADQLPEATKEQLRKLVR